MVIIRLNAPIKALHSDVLNFLASQLSPTCCSSCCQLLGDNLLTKGLWDPGQHNGAPWPVRPVGGPNPGTKTGQRPFPGPRQPAPPCDRELYCVFAFSRPSDQLHRRAVPKRKLATQLGIQLRSKRAGARGGVTLGVRGRLQQCRAGGGERSGRWLPWSRTGRVVRRVAGSLRIRAASIRRRIRSPLTAIGVRTTLPSLLEYPTQLC